METIQLTADTEIDKSQLEIALDDSKLYNVCEKFNFREPQFDPIWLSNQLTLLREQRNGIGLAANQCGMTVRVISVKGFDTALFNPRIVDSSPNNVVLVEGCLSFPLLSLKIKRPDSIRLRWTDAFGETTTKVWGGLTARIIQHEIDHLDGIVFLKRASKFHRDQGYRKRKAYK